MFEWLDYAFMIRALAATTVMSFAIAPVGAFLVLRRLSLAGEAMAHAIVPGIVIAFVVAGLSVASMIVGGLTAGRPHASHVAAASDDSAGAAASSPSIGLA